MNRYKKILLIIVFILTVLILGYLLYALFFKNLVSPPAGQPTATSSTSGSFPDSGQNSGSGSDDPGSSGLPIDERDVTTTEPNIPKAPKQLIDTVARGNLTETTNLNNRPSLEITLDNNNKDLRYYDQGDGKFYKINKNGTISSLGDKVFHNVQEVTWSPDRNKAILEYPDGANIIYDFNQKTQITLPKHWEEFNFSSDGKQIALKSIGLDPENRYLAIVNSDGSGSKPIEFIGENADKVHTDWSPNKKIIAMYTKGIDFNRQEVFFIGANKENFKSTIIPGRGFQPLWSTEGDKLLYSVYSSDNESKPNLWIVNAEGNDIGTNRKNLKLETWAEKCTFSKNDEVYCAVPKELPKGSGIFPELAKNTADNIYKINLKTGTKSLLAVPDKDYNISQVIIAEDGRYLYFTDTQTNRIHKIVLK